MGHFSDFLVISQHNFGDSWDIHDMQPIILGLLQLSVVLVLCILNFVNIKMFYFSSSISPVVHNIELTTNLGRRRCLLLAPTPSPYFPTSTSDAPWQDLPLPLGGHPYCLQALCADSSQGDIRALGAVWAVTSRPLNNLNVWELTSGCSILNV